MNESQVVNICHDQNTERNLRLLAAQRQLYSDAKRLHWLRFLGTWLLAIAGPIIFLFLPGSRNYVAVVGAVAVLISFVLEGLEDHNKKLAATIQEEFDTDLFSLPWNEVLVGRRVKGELIHGAARQYKGDRDKLVNWYADTSQVPYPLSVLACQRMNLVWDWQLQRHYGAGMLALMVIVLMVEILVALSLKLSLADYLLALLVPSLSALISGFREAREHLRIANDKENLEYTVESLWARGLEDPAQVTVADFRQVQDCIFSYRLKGPLVPDRFYGWLRTIYEADMQATARERSRQAQAVTPRKHD